MKRKVENYIMKKMCRSSAKWKQAQELYEIGQMQAAANFYAEAMQLYCACAEDLIDGTGFVE